MEAKNKLQRQILEYHRRGYTPETISRLTQASSLLVSFVIQRVTNPINKDDIHVT